MTNSSERHKENVEAKKTAQKRWEEETKNQQVAEANKRKIRQNRDINIKQYEGPETDRLENRDRIDKS